MEAIPTAFMKDPVFRKLGEVARVAALDKKERREYEKSLKIYRDNYAIFETERSEGFAKGKAEGLAEGEARGRAEGEARGRAEGEAKGRAEGEAKLIKRMFANGMKTTEIAAATDYTPEKIETILNR